MVTTGQKLRLSFPRTSVFYSFSFRQSASGFALSHCAVASLRKVHCTNLQSPENRICSARSTINRTNKTILGLASLDFS